MSHNLWVSDMNALSYKKRVYNASDGNCLCRFPIGLLLLVVFGLFYSLLLFLCCFDRRSWKFFLRKLCSCFRNVFIENSYSFWKRGTKALKGSSQNISNAAVDHGSQSEYPLPCLFLKLLQKRL